MNWERNKVVGIALVVIGVLMLFGDGFLFKIIGAVFNLALIYIGWRIYREAETDALKVISLVMVALGAFSIISLVPFIIKILLIGVCIYFGWKLVKRYQ